MTKKRYARKSPLFRFFIKVKINKGGCWIWQSALDREGYPTMSLEYKTTRAHRFSYESFRGPIPAGNELDHSCRNPSCVNPYHLEAVPHRENIRRAFGLPPTSLPPKQTGPSEYRSPKCRRGHKREWSPASSCYRRCRVCVAMARAKRRESHSERLK